MKNYTMTGTGHPQFMWPITITGKSIGWDEWMARPWWKKILHAIGKWLTEI